MLILNNQVKVIVPTADNEDRIIPTNELIDQVTPVAGGVTVNHAKGEWFDNGIKYSDNVLVAEYDTTNSTTDEVLTAVLKEVVSPLINQYNQLAVTVQYDGHTFILDSTDLTDTTKVLATITNKTLFRGED